MSNLNRFGVSVYVKNLYYNKYPRIADLDGDGINDYIEFKSTGDWTIWSYSHQTHHFELKTTGDIEDNIDNDDKIIISDFNGDGIGDVWKFYEGGLLIYTLKGNSFEEIFSTPDISSKHNFTLGDFNGDGKTDIFMYGWNGTDWANWQVRLSTGDDFETNYIPRKKTNLKDDVIRPADFNGDGWTDLMITASDNEWAGYYYYISKNSGHDFVDQEYPYGQPSTLNYYIDDFDGDGRDDYLCTDATSPMWEGYSIDHSSGNTSVLMEKVGNGLGVLTKPHYVKLSTALPTTYQKGTDEGFPLYVYQGPLTVVSSVEVDNGLGSMNTFNYYYEGLKIHRQGKGLLGYKKIKITDVRAGIETESAFGYDGTYFFQKNSAIYKRIAGHDEVYESQINGYDVKILDEDTKRIFPYVSSSNKNNLLSGNTVYMTSVYDNYGNPEVITTTYENGVSETVTNTYENIYSSRWLLGRPTATSQVFTDGESTINRLTIRDFDDYNNHLIYETTLSGTNKQLTHSFQYNRDGTLFQESLSDEIDVRPTKYFYDPRGVRIIAIKDTSLTLVTNTYDSYGRLQSKKDLLNNTVTYAYDNLHRQVSVSNSDGSGSTTFYYWADPTSNPLLARYSIRSLQNDGSESRIWYDKLGREIKSYVLDFDGSPIYRNTEYNLLGQVSQTSEPYFSGCCSWNVITYDDAAHYNRKKQLTRPSGRNTTWEYFDNTNSISESTAGKEVTKEFDSDGTLKSVHDDGGDITYTYYPDGKIRTITAPGNNTTSMEYDIAGNQTKLTDPSAGIINYTYNAFGQLLTQINARLQQTILTYHFDGKIKDKTTLEGFTEYTYNVNNQLTEISCSTTGVSRLISYYPNGKILQIQETVPASSPFYTSYTYDNLGRVQIIAHPSSITEMFTYQYGYLTSVSANNQVSWTITGMNSRGQLTNSQFSYLGYNQLQSTYGYDTYGYPSSTVTGSLQSYHYEFQPTTGNLNWRRNDLHSNIQENFAYDPLDRLDKIYRGTTTLLDMAYDDNKGGITLKDDFGTFKYENPGHPYAISEINPMTGPMPDYDQNIDYTSFESVKNISENGIIASFLYNSDNERAKMVVSEGGNTILTRWYPSSQHIKETSNGTTKQYTFIGGDAYTAPILAVVEMGTPTYYYLLRDYLGSITHVVNASNGSVLAEYSYDAWGRMRDPITWINFTPGNEPDLIMAGRGFTGHEHLKWFNLINMNGRVYDPLVGQFLSPDNFVQYPDFTQNFNRYAYCLNNPLVYSDPDGEFVHLIVGAIIGGVTNLVINWNKIDNFGEGLGYFGIGAAAGAIGAGVGAGISSAMAVGSAAGGSSTFAAGFWGTSTALTAASSFTTGAAVGAGAGFSAGFTNGFGNGLMQGQNFGEALWSGTKDGLIGGTSGALLGGIVGGVDASIDNRNFWNGKTKDPVVNGWRHLSGGGWKAMPGERQGYYLTEHNEVIPSWRADILTANQSNFSSASAQGMTIDFNAGSRGSFKFTNKTAFGLNLRITGLQIDANLQAFANNNMFFSTPSILGNFNNFASSYSWLSTFGNGPGKGSFTLMFFK